MDGIKGKIMTWNHDTYVLWKYYGINSKASKKVGKGSKIRPFGTFGCCSEEPNRRLLRQVSVAYRITIYSLHEFP